MKRFEEYQRHFSAVPGWFDPMAAAIWDVLLGFQHKAGIKGHLLEIGVFRGRSAGMLALHCQPEEELVLVDPWLTDEVRERITQAAPTARCHFLQQRSQHLVRHPFLTAMARGFRWVHIDGEHAGEAVSNDLDIADRLLDDGGLVVLDDFFSPGYPQITRAVFHFLSRHPERLSLVLCGFNKGYLCRPKAARVYLNFIRHTLVSELAERGMGEVTLWKTNEPADMNTFGITPAEENLTYRGLDANKDIIPF